MRFLTAFFALQADKEIILTGSEQLKKRPIKILVDALRKIGADISYTEKDGFPPLKINRKTLTKNTLSLQANVSSQYISALLLIAPKLKNGLQLTLEEKITSLPYIKMTLALLNQIGIQTSFKENEIIVFPQEKIENKSITVEPDWSSASYFYSIVALSDVGTKIQLSSYKKNSLQGDVAVADIYENFDVKTIFKDDAIIIQKTKNKKQKTLIKLDLSNTPDIAQTIAVSCFGLHIPCHLIGLQTLSIKETNRLHALQTELTKLGANITVTDCSLILHPSTKINTNIAIQTYEDHRMAMAFAPLACKIPIIIKNATVVSKSYPNFWEDVKKIAFQIERI